MEELPREAIFSRLVEESQELLVFIVRNYASGENARDLYQEILLQLWQSLAVFKGEASYPTWAYRVALNTASGFLKRRVRAADITVHGVPEAILENVKAPPQMDGTGLLQEFIGSLAETNREIFTMYLNDLSYHEISEITGLGENCLRMRISRLKKRFEERYIRR